MAYGLRISGRKKKKFLTKRVEHYLRQASLWDEVKDRLRDPASGLSIGQQQRLCLARGLAVDPAIILADEPTSALDPVSSQAIEEKFLELKDRYTIVMVTHVLRQARRIADHGVPITIKARQLGITPQEVVDKYHRIIKDSFNRFGISFDIYSRTSSKVHHQMASEFFRTLYDKGEFVEKTTEQYYDEEAKQFLADRYIVGTCPHCANENAYGDQCEKCGTSLNATDLINPRSTISGNKPVLRETSHWFLPLDRYEPFLKKWILEEHKEWKTNVYGQCKSWLDMGLQPRAVSRDLDWGVPVPVEGANGKVLYVWFDAPIGYISATKELTPDWEKYWKSQDTRIVHFIGKDNIVFHCIMFPAMS